MRLFLGVVVLVATLLAGAIHVASIYGIDTEAQVPAVWVFHIGAIVAIWLAFAFGLPKGRSWKTLSSAFVLVPIWARVLIVAALINCLVNFALVLPQTDSGLPEQRGGRYVFNNHGVIRDVSEAEYHAKRALIVRGFSSVWFYLYLVSSLYLLTARREP